MINRFSLNFSKEKLDKYLGYKTLGSEYRSSYNISPIKKAFVLTQNDPKYLSPCIWGLLPHWSKRPDISGNLYNVDRIGISSKSSYRIPIRQRRCIIPADSYYIFNKNKEAYRVMLEKPALMLIAGVYDEWNDEKTTIRTFSMITKESDEYTKHIHSAMPVIIPFSEMNHWINQQLTLKETLHMLERDHSIPLKAYRITNKIINPDYNAPEIHEEIIPEMTLFNYK